MTEKVLGVIAGAGALGFLGYFGYSSYGASKRRKNEPMYVKYGKALLKPSKKSKPSKKGISEEKTPISQPSKLKELGETAAGIIIPILINKYRNMQQPQPPEQEIPEGRDDRPGRIQDVNNDIRRVQDSDLDEKNKDKIIKDLKGIIDTLEKEKRNDMQIAKLNRNVFMENTLVKSNEAEPKTFTEAVKKLNVDLESIKLVKIEGDDLIIYNEFDRAFSFEDIREGLKNANRIFQTISKIVGGNTQLHSMTRRLFNEIEKLADKPESKELYQKLKRVKDKIEKKGVVLGSQTSGLIENISLEIEKNAPKFYLDNKDSETDIAKIRFVRLNSVQDNQLPLEMMLGIMHSDNLIVSGGSFFNAIKEYVEKNRETEGKYKYFEHIANFVKNPTLENLMKADEAIRVSINNTLYNERYANTALKEPFANLVHMWSYFLLILKFYKMNTREGILSERANIINIDFPKYVVKSGFEYDIMDIAYMYSVRDDIGEKDIYDTIQQLVNFVQNNIWNTSENVPVAYNTVLALISTIKVNQNNEKWVNEAKEKIYQLIKQHTKNMKDKKNPLRMNSNYLNDENTFRQAMGRSYYFLNRG